MMGQATIKRILEQALAASKADQTEALLIATNSRVTRFANSAIHQHMAESNAELRVRVVFDEKIGVASTNRLSDQGVVEAVDAASRAARLSTENRDFVSLPGPEPVRAVRAYDERTASYPPEGSARLVGVVCRRATDAGLLAAGALTTTAQELGVANSLGISAYYPLTCASLVAVVMSDDGSGYAESVSTKVDDIDAEAVAREAVDKTQRSRQPIELAPGEYEVVLEEYAVHDLVGYVASLGFNALAFQEGRSFVVGRLGQQVVGTNVDIWDDGLDEAGLPLPFDYEGVPKRRVDLIKRGRAVSLVYDSYTAGREGKASTGHALPAPNPNGPVPINLFMAAGEATKEEMIAATRRGILVTRFHYTNPADRRKAIITGMTRDGTFLIENGQITRPVKNLRFTQSYLEALSNVEMIGHATRLHRNSMGAIRAPALKIARWTFQQATLY